MPTPAVPSAGATPELLLRAFSPLTPGPALPPGPAENPWHDLGATPVADRGQIGELLDAMWAPDGVHLAPDGSPTRVARRPVPSAGGTYAVRVHVVVPAAAPGALAPGRYAHRLSTGDLLHRTDSRDLPAGDRVSVVFTVLPGRSFGRYRHRAWPLWIADTAYAMAGLTAALHPDDAAAITVRTGPLDRIRRLADLPAARDAETWLARGLVPEPVVAALDLPARWRLDSRRVTALGQRRSPALKVFAANRNHAARDRTAADRAGIDAALGASGQSWLAGSDRLLLWELPAGPGSTNPAVLSSHLWSVHLAAARLCFAAALGNRWATRPVSGFGSARRGPHLVHGLAALDTTTVRSLTP